MAKTVMFLVATLMLVGCGPTTVGESCDLLGKTVCERCFPQETSACLSGAYSSCCRGSTCEMPVRDSGKVLECNNLLKSASCSSLVQGNAPAVCVGVAAP